MRLFQRVQVLALDVLDNGDLEGAVVVQHPHQGRDRAEPGPLGGTPAPLTGDDLILGGLAGRRPHQDRLQHALVADRGLQLGDLGFGEMPARLIGIGVDQLDGDLAHAVGRRHGVGDLLRLAQQGGQPTSQSSAGLSHYASSYAAARRRSRSRNTTSRASFRYAWLPAHFRS